MHFTKLCLSVSRYIETRPNPILVRYVNHKSTPWCICNSLRTCYLDGITRFVKHDKSPHTTGLYMETYCDWWIHLTECQIWDLILYLLLAWTRRFSCAHLSALCDMVVDLVGISYAASIYVDLITLFRYLLLSYPHICRMRRSFTEDTEVPILNIINKQLWVVCISLDSHTVIFLPMK